MQRIHANPILFYAVKMVQMDSVVIMVVFAAISISFLMEIIPKNASVYVMTILQVYLKENKEINENKFRS